MINLTVVIDNDEAIKKLEELQKVAKQSTSSIVTDAERIDEAMRLRPQIDKNAAKKAEKTMQAIAEAMSLNNGANHLAGIEETLTHLPEKANAAAGGFNNLNFATQQLVREVPAATMGLHMFFLAISNNLPFFADAIKQVREENKALAASGKPTVGVFKQIIGSLFSWQTALIAGITVLTLYGKEIGKWIASLFRGKKGIDAVTEAQKGLNEAIKENGLGIGDEIIKYKELSEAYKKLGEDMDARKKFIVDNKDAFHDLGIEVWNVADANKALVDGTPAVIAALTAQASAAAARNLAEKALEEQITAEINAKNIRSGGSNWWDIVRSGMSYTPFTGVQVAPSYYKEQRAQAEEQRASDAAKLVEEYLKQSKEYAEQATKAFKAAGVTTSDPYTNYDAKALEDATRKLARDAAQARTDANVAAMREGLKREIAAINSNYDAKERAIADREKDMALKNKNGKLTAEQSAYFGTLYAANNQERKREILEAQKREADKIATMAKTTRTLQLDAAQSEVDAMKEGEAKVLAEIDLKYRKRREQLENRQRELMKSQNGILTGKQAQMFGQMYENIDQEEANEIEEHNKKKLASFDDYLIKYGKIQEKILATTRKYEREIADAQSEGERKMLEAERDAELVALSGKSDLFVRLFGNANRMSRAQLKSVIADTKQLLDYLREASDIKPIGFTEEQLKALKDDAEKIGAIYDELYEKQEEMERRNEYPFSNIINALKKLKEAREAEAEAEKEQNAESRQRKLEIVESLRQEAGELGKIAASKAADTVTEIADAFMRLAEATDNANLKETAEQLGAFAQNLSAAGQGAASGGWIGAIVGGASDMLMQTIDAIIGKQAEVHEYEQNRLDFMRQYQLMLLELNDSDYDSVFGTANLRKASDAWEKMAEAERLYKEATEGALGQFGGKMKEIANAGIGAFLYAPSLLDSRTTEEYKAYLDALQKGYNALEGMRVKTVDRSGWANFWGAKDEYTNLKDLAPELWGEDGLFNADAARAFLETNTQLTDEQRKQIQNAIDLKDKYDEALSEIDQQIESIFGDLASDMTDIIFDSVRNGTDAWDEFGKKGSEIIDALGKQMLQEMIMTEYLEQYTDDLRAAFASGDSSQIAGVVNNIFDNMGMMFEGMSAAAQAWDDNAKEMGFDMNNISQTATTARGFQTMSQETGSELNGRFTDIQGQTHRISEAVEFIKGISVTQLQQTTSISETVAQIHNDTSLIEKHTRELAYIRAGIDKIASNTSEL